MYKFMYVVLKLYSIEIRFSLFPPSNNFSVLASRRKHNWTDVRDLKYAAGCAAMYGCA